MENWLHTAILTTHVLGAAIVIGAAFVSLIVQSKKPPVVENLKLTGQVWKLAGFAFGAQILTGLYLSANEWDEFGKNPFLWVKFILIIAAGFLGTLASKNGSKKMGLSSLQLAWISLLIYLGLAVFGVLLAESAG